MSTGKQLPTFRKIAVTSSLALRSPRTEIRNSEDDGITVLQKVGNYQSTRPNTAALLR